jgi:2,4-dienoyl-CoA reductase-like NADH-dependent reductase (Old Yellow Enzyme family)
MFLVLQLTHSGRYTKPEGKSIPLVAQFNPYLDRNRDDVHILSDTELDHLQIEYVRAARLAFEAGFDAVDIKACHGYLVNELLAAFTREGSKYGGTFENRTRFLTEVIHRIHQEVPELLIAVRMNATDMIPHPYGYGVPQDDPSQADLSEPKALMKELVRLGCSIINVTIGNPYFNTHIGRPYDRWLPGSSRPDEHPLEGVARLIAIAGALQKECPEIHIVGTGYSWLRHFFPSVGAAVLSQNLASFIGLGRSSFAYPDAPRDLVTTGRMNPKKVCITCSKCTEMMRYNLMSGCAVHDPEIYAREYGKIQLRKGQRDGRGRRSKLNE